MYGGNTNTIAIPICRVLSYPVIMFMLRLMLRDSLHRTAACIYISTHHTFQNSNFVADITVNAKAQSARNSRMCLY